MSEEKFKEAKRALANSQSIYSRIHAKPEIQEGMEQPEEQPMDPYQTAQEALGEGEEPQDIAKAVQDAMVPYMEEIKNLIEKSLNETKDVEVKIAGEMSPKEEEDPSIAKDST